MSRLPQATPPFPAGEAIAPGPLPTGESVVSANEPAAGAAPFTKRERQILDLLARGLQNREIGTQLGISGVTVKNHLYRVFEKLGTRTRIEAALKWLGR